MNPPEAAFAVVKNDRGQYSIWPAGGDEPAGWQRVGVEGTRASCLERICELWTDLRPTASVDHERSDGLAALFEAVVARMPDGAATQHGNRVLSFDALNQAANRCARCLRRVAGANGVVGFCTEPSIDLVIGVIAAAKAGIVLVICDPGQPWERNARALEHAGAAVLVTSDTIEARDFDVSFTWSLLRTAAANEDADNLQEHVDSESAHSIVFTSGSSGVRKGVMIPIRAVIARLRAMHARHPFTASDVALLHRSPAIAGVSWDIFGPLTAGIRLVIFSEGAHAANAGLWQVLADHQVSYLGASPSTWQWLCHQMMRYPGQWRALRFGASGGELLQPDFIARWRQTFPTASLVNIYGSTESLYPATWEVSSVLEPGQPADAGTALGDNDIYVVDHCCPTAGLVAEGEIAISGQSLAIGYHRDAGLTAERFLPNPYAMTPGARMFVTGDKGCWTQARRLRVLGRLDNRVKVRGHTVDPLEVEGALRSCEGVSDVAVIVERGRPGRDRLVAFVRLQHGAELDQVRDAIRGQAPEYMLPTRYVIVPEMPLSPSGKVDRDLLRSTL